MTLKFKQSDPLHFKNLCNSSSIFSGYDSSSYGAPFNETGECGSYVPDTETLDSLTSITWLNAHYYMNEMSDSHICSSNPLRLRVFKQTGLVAASRVKVGNGRHSSTFQRCS